VVLQAADAAAAAGTADTRGGEGDWQGPAIAELLEGVLYNLALAPLLLRIPRLAGQALNELRCLALL